MASITALRDSGSALSGRLVVSRDVSARYRAEAALQEAMKDLARSEREFSTLVENSPFIFTRFDRALRHVYVSPMIREVTGLAPEDFVGKTHEEVGMPAELAARWRELLGDVFANATVAETRFSFHTPNGGLRHYEARAKSASARVPAVKRKHH